MSDIVKKDDKANNALTSFSKGKLKSTSTPFQQRAKQAQREAENADTLPNRLCLMLDGSSSMNESADYSKGLPSKIHLLHEAIDNFVSRCNFSDTAIAIETFPPDVTLPLTNIGIHIISTAQSLRASGNTPMHNCVERCLPKLPLTRGILVSDGDATDWGGYYSENKEADADAILLKYKEAGIPIDCVHIGESSGGEELLRRIAKLTGGIYCKFTDVGSFATAFAYLTPGFRAMLTSGRVSAESLGADEIRL